MMTAATPSIFERPAPSRQCGSCHACCVHVPMPDMGKPVGTPCQYLKGRHACSAGSCSIYDQRPAECATYQCAWLEGFFPTGMRPDKSGLLFELGWIEWPRKLFLLEGYETRAGAGELHLRRPESHLPPGCAGILIPHGKTGPFQVFGRDADVETLLTFLDACQQRGGVTLAHPDGLRDIPFHQADNLVQIQTRENP